VVICPPHNDKRYEEDFAISFLLLEHCASELRWQFASDEESGDR
jgi:hypothetical protein